MKKSLSELLLRVILKALARPMLLSSAKKKPTIGLTPLIDVVFILLIFFMLVMQFQQFQQNSVDLSERNDQGIINNEIAQITIVDKEQCLYKNSLVKCSELLSQISNESINTVSIAYQKNTFLSDIMYWHDVYSENFETVSLAVLLPIKGGGDE